MFYHTVLINFSNTDEAFFKKLDSFVERMRSAGDGILEFGFVRNQAERNGGFPYGFQGKFVDEAAHERYQVSQVHLEFKEFLGPHMAGIIVLDHDTDLSI